jgi:hypothetical protein
MALRSPREGLLYGQPAAGRAVDAVTAEAESALGVALGLATSLSIANLYVGTYIFLWIEQVRGRCHDISQASVSYGVEV